MPLTPCCAAIACCRSGGAGCGGPSTARQLTFCCYGCCIAYQVRRGHGEESEATWLLIRLGIGGFLAMNVMTFSLVVYSGGFEGIDASLLPWVHLLLWLLATPVLFLLGGPFLGDTWRQAREGRLGSAVADHDRGRRVLSVFGRQPADRPRSCLFRYRDHAAGAVHARPLSRSAGPRARDPQPRAAAGSRGAMGPGRYGRCRDARRRARPCAGSLGARAAGRTLPGRWSGRGRRIRTPTKR